MRSTWKLPVNVESRDCSRRTAPPDEKSVKGKKKGCSGAKIKQEKAKLHETGREAVRGREWRA
jgi:hypothetical protein